MMFDFLISNPPYQGDNHRQIYPDFYLAAKDAANCVEMIFPVGWQEPKNANNLSKLNKQEIKEDKQIVFIDNRQNVFNGVAGAEWTNVVMWRRGHDNRLNGRQLVSINGGIPEAVSLKWDKSQIVKPQEIVDLAWCVQKFGGFASLQTETSSLKPYGLRTDVFDDPHKYGLPPFNESKMSDTDLTIYGLLRRRRTTLYAPNNYPLPKWSPATEKYKVFIGKAWGGFEDTYLGGTYADIVIASPYEICTENYLESGYFNDFKTAQKHAKYLLTRFARALLYMCKHTRDNSKEKWGAVPIQDYSEPWWNLSIEEIDEKLMDKYSVPQNIRDFVKSNIQTKSEANIVNYKEDE